MKRYLIIASCIVTIAIFTLSILQKNYLSALGWFWVSIYDFKALIADLMPKEVSEDQAKDSN